MKPMANIRTELVKIAADLLTGYWSSPYAEDNPPRTSRRIINGLKKDAGHRGRLANDLKRLYDDLKDHANE